MTGAARIRGLDGIVEAEEGITMLDTYADLVDDDFTAVADALDHRATRTDVAISLSRRL